MFLQLAFKELRVVSVTKRLVKKCYEIVQEVPANEKGHLVQQLKQAVLAAHLSCTEGAFLQGTKKGNKQFKAAQRSLILADAALELLLELGFIKAEMLHDVADLLVTSYELLDLLIQKK